MKTLFFAVVFSLLIGCNRTSVTSPEPIVLPEEEHPTRVDTDFTLDNYHGIIAFGLGHPGQSEEDVLRFIHASMSLGWNTFEICSETEFWDNSPGYPQKPRDTERLNWLLDIIAHVPGAQVALIGNCTLKRQIPLDQQVRGFRAGGMSEAEAFAWSEQVAKIAKDYKNIAIFTHNEFDNCYYRDDWGGDKKNCAGKQEVAKHIRMYKSYGFRYVTADDSFSPPDPNDLNKSYTFRLANVGANPASFHPDREKNGKPWDPSLNQLRELGRYNGTYILSETVAWADFSGNCSGLRTCDQTRIQNYINSCAQVPECKFTYHCENCLAGEVPTYIPIAR